MLKKVFISLIFSLILIPITVAQPRQSSSDTVMVLPFENSRGLECHVTLGPKEKAECDQREKEKANFNWVGESFADSMSSLLKVPAWNVISNDERKLIQQRLRIPLTNIPSLGTSLRLAREANASVLISGRYTIFPATADAAALVSVAVRIVRINEGRVLTETFGDGRIEIPPVELSDALGNLQTVQALLAFKILHLQFKTSLELSQNDLIVAATKVPPKAFEAYTKGLLTPSPESRENYFKNAIRLVGEASPGAAYSAAYLELGHLYREQKKFSDSVSSFEKVVSTAAKCLEQARIEKKIARCGNESYAEASFYIGLIYWQQGNYEAALATLRPLIDDLTLVTVYNSIGAIAVQASRAEKKNPAKAAALLNEGMELLKKASDSAPDDANIRFNYATTLFLNGNTVDAAAQLRSAIAANPRDGEAYFVLSKALDALKDSTTADINNQAQRFLTENNRYAKLETEWQKSKTINDISLRVNQPARKDFVAVVLSRKPVSTTTAQISETETMLGLARTLIKNGNDDEAMTTLRRVLNSEPMSAESYLLLGKIHLRRGDIDQAISSFKTSVFWDNRLIDAHVSLGKISVEKGDCLQAKSYTASALEIGPENPDALALQRLSQRCSK